MTSNGVGVGATSSSTGHGTGHGANDNSYIVRDRHTFLRPTRPQAAPWATVLVRQAPPAKRAPTRTCAGGISSLPQIAIKRKDDSCANQHSEVVLLNGNWDTSNEIPNIIAEMHNVNVEELQGLHHHQHHQQQQQQQQLQYPAPGGGVLGSKQAKLDAGASSSEVTLGSPVGSDSGIEGDCSEGNLSWLLNYKIQELPPVPDCAVPETHFYNGIGNFASNHNHNHQHHQQQQQQQQHHGNLGGGNVAQTYAVESSKPVMFRQIQNTVVQTNQRDLLEKDAANCRIEEGSKTPNNSSYRYTGLKKPPFTYTELIEHALNEKGELTVSGIYQWISDHFPFYKQNDDRWKNSVRHNLSINPHFRKGSKAIHGAGHLWTIAQKEDKKTWNIKKQRMQQFIQTTLHDWNKQRQQEIELAAATASILPDARDDNNHANVLKMEIGSPQIESGCRKQNVEVEYIIDMSTGLGVSKEEVVEECGLGGDYLITDLNPNALGLNLTEAEIVNGASLYDDLNFQCYELQTE